ncbi:MAG: Uma2 family endonuclease [Deltaproteobacteria bacterium]|nr:Uma2 family endonuclease [Deltaproteobacteria bacterium]
MSEARQVIGDPGPFTSRDLPPGSGYELDDGHPVLCMPSGGDSARGAGAAFQVLDTDPGVEEAGFDPGYELGERTVRAPDIGVGNVPAARGWISGVPRLAVEYASSGQDEAKLQEKIELFLTSGTEWVWVVRLLGPQRVEVYQKNKAVQVLSPGQLIEAPGFLKNPVPVKAMFDRDEAHEVALSNLLQRRGYSDLSEVGKEGREEGRKEGLRAALVSVLEARGLEPTEAQRHLIAFELSAVRLERWVRAAALAETVDRVLADS